jgi:hypothetical protein
MAIALPAAPLVRGGSRRVFSLPESTSSIVNWVGFSLVIVVTLVCLAVPVLAPYDPLTPAGMPLQAPGKGGFLLGTDSIGRDILSRVLYGARSSWFAALVVVAIGLLIGGLVGLIAGTVGGWVDTVLMRITDAFLSLPAPVLAIAVVAALGPGFVHTLIAVSIVGWPFYARLVRGEVVRPPAAWGGTQRGGGGEPRHRHADPHAGGAVVPRARTVRSRTGTRCRQRAQSQLLPAAVVDSGDAGNRRPGAGSDRQRGGGLPAESHEGVPMSACAKRRRSRR